MRWTGYASLSPGLQRGGSVIARMSSGMSGRLFDHVVRIDDGSLRGRSPAKPGAVVAASAEPWSRSRPQRSGGPSNNGPSRPSLHSDADGQHCPEDAARWLTSY